MDVVNRFGLVYTISGSDESLSPILLTANQDVVPVEEKTLDQWVYPPFDAVYDKASGYLWGRGASDDKSAITALMSAMEALLSQKEYQPSRTVIGGHSSTPPPHTAIGIMAQIVADLEANPFKAEILWNSPVHHALICLARYSPDAMPELAGYINHDDLEAAACVLTELSPQTQYFIQTSQAVDVISGGDKINSLPEFVTLGVNYRYAPQDSIGAIQHRIVNIAESVTRKYHICLKAFEGDEDYEEYLVAQGISREEKARNAWQPVYNGTLILEARKKSYITGQSPASGRVWDAFGGTVRHAYADQVSHVVVAPGAMTGNTDTRHYLRKYLLGRGVNDRRMQIRQATNVRLFQIELSDHVYRWSPGSVKSFGNIHTINKRLLMSEHINMAKFYYDFIRTFDQVEL